MMAAPVPRGGWLIMLTLLLALLLSVAPMPAFMDIGRPLWLALFLSFWVLSVPHRLGLTTAWLFGLAEDVLYGSLLGQNALVLMLTTFFVLTLHQRLRLFPLWQQSVVLLVLFGIPQLVQLWLFALAGNRPPEALKFLYPVLISALLWPWVHTLLRGLRVRLQVS